jgi:hypothetical protein
MRIRIAMLALVLFMLSSVGARDVGFSGSIYGTTSTVSSGACPAGSGWKKFPGGTFPTTNGWIGIIPADVTGAETLAVELLTAFDAAGNGSRTVETFTTVTSTNVSQFKEIDAADLPLHRYFCVSHTITGTPSAPGHTFGIYSSYID